jgi:hypothetical protein
MMDVLEIAAQFARTMYTNEFCSICGKAITIEEAKSAISVTSRENKASRLSHKECSSRYRHEEDSAYPADSLVNQ